MPNEDFKQLLEKYLTNSITHEQYQRLGELSRLRENQLLLQQMLDQDLAEQAFTQQENVALRELLYQQIDKKITQQDHTVIELPKRRFDYWRAVAAAAIIILMTSVGSYFLFFYHKNVEQPIAIHEATKDVQAPKITKATITLASGKKIVLETAANGIVATEGTVAIQKTGEGAISYSGNQQQNTAVAYNTLTNPRGSKVVTLTLSDGTKVWLNSESSLKYPTAFTGNERTVEITGEAYFEVTHRDDMPFKVRKDNTEVTVLGTHFNVNAYDDENQIKVTLLEGSVEVALRRSQGERSSVKIKPGEQVTLQRAQDDIQVLKNVDVEQVMAWKNGMFRFEGTNIEAIMRQVKRWYDVDVTYQVNTQNLNFSGVVGRKESVSELLKIMELTGLVHFKIENKKIIVMK